MSLWWLDIREVGQVSVTTAEKDTSHVVADTSPDSVSSQSSQPLSATTMPVSKLGSSQRLHRRELPVGSAPPSPDQLPKPHPSRKKASCCSWPAANWSLQGTRCHLLGKLRKNSGSGDFFESQEYGLLYSLNLKGGVCTLGRQCLKNTHAVG